MIGFIPKDVPPRPQEASSTIGLIMAVQAIGGSLIDIHQRLEKIGDYLYGSGPRAVATYPQKESEPVSSVKSTLESISHALVACNEELSRIERGL